MKESYIYKMKTLLVAIFLVASALFVFNIYTEKVIAGDENDAAFDGSFGNISINGLQEQGQYVSGVVNISWDSTLREINNTYPIVYNVTFSRGQTDGWRDHINGQTGEARYIGNLSAEMGNATSYLWNTTTEPIEDGTWWVNVTAGYIYNKGAAGECFNWTNASTGAVKMIVSNTCPGVPGDDIYQGGNYWFVKSEADNGTTNELPRYTSDSTGMSILDIERFNYEVGAAVDLSVNSSVTWTGTYYLYYPDYDGSSSDDNNQQYSIDWRRYSDEATIGGSDSDFGTITFDRSGIWIISDDANTSFDCSNVATMNNTVDAWFWVNTSDDYNFEADVLPDTFGYNSTGALTITVRDEDELQPTALPRCVVDIRAESNGSSIQHENQVLDSGWSLGPGDAGVYWKNNSYHPNDELFPGSMGFWHVGNYSVYAYRDTDLWKDGAEDESDGKQYYLENNMDKTDRGWYHYNKTYGSNAYKNGSAAWLSYAAKYNYRLAGPWDPPEHNCTPHKIRVTTGTPYMTITQNETVNYGFAGTVNISLSELSGGSALDQARVNVTIWDDDDVNVTDKFQIFNSVGAWGSSRAARDIPTFGAARGGWIVVHKTGGKKGWIHINMTRWGQNYSDVATEKFADNGTWEVKIWVDYGESRELNGKDKQWTEEWNGSITFRVQSAPSAQFQWIDDDGIVGGTNNWGTDNSYDDGIIPYVPGHDNVPLDVQFKVADSGGNYFGDLTSGKASGICESLTQCAANITITGNSIFTGKLSSFPGFSDPGDTASNEWFDANKIWHVPIIPTMSIGGGTIQIDVSAYNATVTQTLTIGGVNYEQNGSVVSVTPNEFNIDESNRTLEVTALYADDGDAIRTATVHLYYIDDTAGGTINRRCGPIYNHSVVNITDSTNDIYSLLFNKTQQMFNQTTGLNGYGGAGFDAISAPRNLTIYVDGPGRRDGYALIQMAPMNDLELEIEGETTYTMMAGYEYDDFEIKCTFVNGTEGRDDNDYPDTDDRASFFIKIFDEEGEDVTGTSSATGLLKTIYDTLLRGDSQYRTTGYTFEFDSVWGPVTPLTMDTGTFTLYAYNNTHNSAGHNATLIVKPIDITVDNAPFIWMSDKNISATFTITYDGSPVDGTLVIDNMTDEGNYNRTWMNVSFNGNTKATNCGDEAGQCNNTLEIDHTKINEGVVTVHDITASVMTAGYAKQKHTLWFKPSESEGGFAKASSWINTEVPTVVPDPNYIPQGRTTTVYCTAQGRNNEVLSNVYIRLHGQGFDQNGTTDVDGLLAFSVYPYTNGNISIDVGEEGRTLEDTVIYVVSWVIDAETYVDGALASEVAELKEFIVKVIKESTTTGVEGAKVKIAGIGTSYTDANGEVTFTAREVTSDRTYTVVVSAEGYAPDPDGLTITVINIPKLLLVSPESAKATENFDIAVADDTGTAIVGAIITFNEQTYTTGFGGTATLKAPKTKGTYTISVTFGNYDPKSATIEIKAAPQVPGFELLTLIAAIGVALIMLRRRKR